MSIGLGIAISPSFEGSHIPGVSALFSYAKSSFNQGEADPTPTITGNTGGTFSGTSGLVFVDSGGSADSLTGQIDLSASSIATHTITYTVSGVSSNFELGITAAPYSSTRSFSFDGVNDYFDIGNDINFEYNDAFSYSFWVNPSSISGVKYLFSKYASSRGILIYLNSSSTSGNNSLEFNLYNKASGSPSTRKQINTNSSSMALPNEWTNIVITYDGSGLGSGVDFYKNGLIQTVTVTQDTLDGNTILTSQDAYIAGNNFASSFFSGKIDEVSLWDSALSSDAVTEIYNSGAPNSLTSLTHASSSALVAWYKMGE